MGFLERAIRCGVSDAVGKAIGGAVKDAVQPTAEKYANRAAQRIDEAAAAANQSAQQTAQAAQSVNATAKSGGFAGLEGALGNLQRSMEGLANEAAKNMKNCPSCGETTSADKKFCPSCGAKLPEQTIAQGAVCPGCGKQNDIGTKFCSDCGTKLPSAIAEEQAAADKNASVMARWDTVLSQYPKWSCGGNRFDFDIGDGYVMFSAYFAAHFAAQNAVEQYRDVLRQNGFREAGQYPSKEHLYKKSGGVCYHVDTEHCFEGDDNKADVYFMQDEPEGGFDYVKPAPKPQKGLFDLFK